MSLTILNVAYPCAPVGPDSVGGSEQIISALDSSLTRAGHRSIVVAAAGSEVAGTLVPTEIPALLLTPEVRAEVRIAHQRSIDAALARFSPDLIHLHGIDFDAYHFPENLPVLVTLHLSASVYSPSIWAMSHLCLQCVSYTQRNALPAVWRDSPVITNGTYREDAKELHLTRRNFALALGRICPEKNFHVAMDAGREAGTPVWLGGRPYGYREHTDYYLQEILPRLRDGHRFLGTLTTARKNRLLAAAKCLLIASLAPETSSLVAMEALSAGTPVIAFPSGALPEIIRDGVTGFLVGNQHDMAVAIRHVKQISSERCREEAKERFSRSRMISEYLSLYSILTQRSCGKPHEDEEVAMHAARPERG